MDLDAVKELVFEDGLREIETPVGPALLHTDHRFVLPLIDLAQRQGRLPRPAHHVLFDRFHDSTEPLCMDKLRAMRKRGFTTAGLIDLCKNHLRKTDDDWVQAGMHLGLIGNVILFGHEPSDHVDFPLQIEDSAGEIHRMDSLYLPCSELEYQGSLSDSARRLKLETLWETLGWEMKPRDRFRFTGQQRLVLDIDLQCFALEYREYTFPWPERIFEAEFLTPSTYVTVEGVTAQQFVRELASNAGLLTIAREANFCGGEADADWILEKVQQYAFGKGMAPLPKEKVVVN
ncbi:MAG: hypothetical protein FJW32_23065 [Acidobacteria bacterium]|nr:hypothetical protein [Acidobacteriota bacterium]